MSAWHSGNEDWRLNEMSVESHLALKVDRLDFFPYACIVCRRSAVHCAPTSLSRCGKCKRVHYCSRKCQKQDFKQHKYLCQIMHDIPLQNDVKTQYEWGLYLKSRLRDMRATSQAFYGKDIWLSCFSIWMYQPHCQTCFAQDNLTVCETCGCVARCNKDSCISVFHTTHSKQSCESHCVRLAAYVMAKQQGNYLKVASQSRNAVAHDSSSALPPVSIPPTSLPSSWASYWTAKVSDYEVPEALLRIPPVMAMLTDSMSYIFTAMHCLQQLHIHQLSARTPDPVPATPPSTLCIHFIGSEVLDVFGAQAGVFEEILHWFPSVTSLELVLVGPDLQADREGERRLISQGLCTPCASRHCTVHLTCLRALYHEAALSADHPPHIAMLCNSGLHESSAQPSGPGSLAESWAPTLEMLHAQRVPIAATSYTREESEEDFQQVAAVLQSDGTYVGGEGVVVQPSRNPFRGLLPMPDTLADNQFFYNNNYYFVLSNCH